MLVEVERKLVFLHRFPRSIQILNFMIIWRVKCELLQLERQTMWKTALILR